MKRTNKETELKIIELYNNGLSMKNAGEPYNVSAATVKAILERNNIPKRTKGGIYKLPDEEIIKRYTSGESCQQIADSFSVGFHTISNILETYNIPRDNKYYNLSLNIDYFSTIDSYDKAYFLGFMIADGNVGLRDNSICLDLAAKDREILETFKIKTGNANKLYEREDKNTVAFRLKSTKWKEDLAQYGVIPQKTSTAHIPEIDENLMPHLIRGLIDGDGWISAKSHQIGFCGNKTTVTQLRNFLVKNLQVYEVSILHTEEHLWQITWASKSDITKIGQYIYKDKKDCYLKRKFENFQLIQGNTEVIN